jgi:hypothetical protein
MNSTTSLQAIVNAINESGVMFVKCWALIMLVLGTIGHSLSIYVFTRPTLRANPCCRYLLMATFAGLFVTCFNQPVRLLQVAYNNIDPAARSLAFCKISWFLLYTSR